MRLIHIGNWYSAQVPFARLFDETLKWNPLIQLTKDDVVLFGGGSDISPSIYGKTRNKLTGAMSIPSDRDRLEIMVFNEAREVGSKSLGICRGAQLLCALSGGTLIQHVENHASYYGHDIRTDAGEVFTVSSSHHQMMNPFGTEHELIAWSEEVLSPLHLGEDGEFIEVKLEPEVVYFPHTEALAIQYHPEFMSDGDRGVDYSRELVSKYLLGENFKC